MKLKDAKSSNVKRKSESQNDILQFFKPKQQKTSCSTDDWIFPGFITHKTPANGDCLFMAIADQLDRPMSDADMIRRDLVMYLQSNHQDFVTEENWDVLLSEEGGFENYIKKMSAKAAWGDGTIIEVAMRFYNRPVIVISGQNKNERSEISYPGLESNSKPLYLGYSEFVKGKGNNHYVSLVPTPNIHDCLDTASTDNIIAQDIPIQGTVSATSSVKATSVTHTSMEKINLLHKNDPQDLNETEPTRPSGPFPLSTFKDRERSFMPQWYVGRPWLEYSTEKNAAFCFCCRNFSKSSANTGEYAFRRNGFKKWKIALERKRGFAQHESSVDHIHSLAAWKEYKLRQSSHTEVSTLVNASQLESNRYYVTSLFDIIKFIAENEMSLRGDKECNSEEFKKSLDVHDSICSGLFMRLFEYTLKKDEKLLSAFKTIPKVAKYTSPEIQNELISIMAKIVQENIVDEIKTADVPYFTLKVDGTKDPTGTENISIVVRAVKQGKPIEHLLSISTTVALDGDSLATVVLQALTEMGLDPNCIISQCYDGASVMSGTHGGMQAILQQKLSKEIPYVHCYNHQLHLVVMHAMSEDAKVQKYFDLCGSLYNFTRKPIVAAIYDGDKLKRLLDQRWTGHLLTTRTILNNYESIIDLLNHCSKFHDADISVQAIGLKANFDTPDFRFNANLVYSILTLFESPNNLLQSKSMDLLSASALIDSVLESVKKLRIDEEFKKLFDSIFVKKSQTLGLTTTANNLTDKTPTSQNTKFTRTAKVPARYSNYVITETIPNSTSTRSDSTELQFLSLYNGVLDRTITEIENRFNAKNMALLKSLKSLTPFDDNFMNKNELSTLAKLCAVDLTSASACSEIEAAKPFLETKRKDIKITDLYELAEFMYSYRDAFPSLYRLIASALTIGASSSTCEASFSALTRVLTPYRRSMLHQRKADLVLLAYESSVTKKIDSELFLKRFNNSKNRRLQLY